MLKNAPIVPCIPVADVARGSPFKLDLAARGLAERATSKPEIIASEQHEQT